MQNEGHPKKRIQVSRTLAQLKIWNGSMKVTFLEPPHLNVLHGSKISMIHMQGVSASEWPIPWSLGRLSWIQILAVPLPNCMTLEYYLTSLSLRFLSYNKDRIL